MEMGIKICQKGNGNGNSRRDNGNGYFFMRVKIPSVDSMRMQSNKTL